MILTPWRGGTRAVFVSSPQEEQEQFVSRRAGPRRGVGRRVDCHTRPGCSLSHSSVGSWEALIHRERALPEEQEGIQTERPQPHH